MSRQRRSYKPRQSPTFEYPIPHHSVAALGKLRNQSANPGLIFERFAPDWGSAPSKKQSEWKKEGFNQSIRFAADAKALEAYRTRWDALVRGAHAVPFTVKTDWRFITGLGSKGPLEVGFTFHRYGFPFLPGSSVKGLARAWAFFQIVEQTDATDLGKLEQYLAYDGDEIRKYEDWHRNQPEEAKKLANDYRAIFGTTNAAGKAIFFDAIPDSPPKLELDIMNPHFGDYYSGKEPYPTDWQNPVPVFFLTVAAGQKFHFAVGWRGKKDDPDLRTSAEGWLKASLQDLGAGAKTSAGYGYFEE